MFGGQDLLWDTTWEVALPAMGSSQTVLLQCLPSVDSVEGHIVYILPRERGDFVFYTPRTQMLFRITAVPIVIMRGQRWNKSSLKILVGWPLPAAKYPHSYLHPPSPQLDGERIRAVKQRKLMDWDKGSLIGEGKKGGGKASDANAITRYLPQADWCPGSLWAATTLEDTSPSSSALILIFEHDLTWCGISLWVIWVSCPSSSPS